MVGSWDIRRIYLYLVSFATLMMMIFGTVSFLQSVVNVVYPNPGNYADFKVPTELGKTTPQATEAQLQKQLAQQKAQQRYYDITSLIRNLIMIGVALPAYLYHWRKIQRAEA